VGWIVPDQANKTYLSGQWVDFSETTIVQSQFNVYRPGTFGFFGPLRYSKFPSQNPAGIERGFGMLFDRTDPLPQPGQFGPETSIQVGSSNTYTSTRALTRAQKYPLYRYVGPRAEATGTIPSRMPTLLSIDVRMDGDTNVCWQTVAPTVVFSPSRPTPQAQDPTDTIYARTIDTWQHRPQNDYYSGNPYPVSSANDIRKVKHSYQENLCCNETDQVVLTLDPVFEDDPALGGASYKFTHVTSRTGVNLQLPPGTLWLVFAAGIQTYGEGPLFYNISDRTIFDVSVSMTITSDF
tara:strand:+ start:25250 stop:26131 length:882 start_codon:yes stop_codon:yes gene_type:complete